MKKDEQSVDQMAEEAKKVSDDSIADQIDQVEDNPTLSSEELADAESADVESAEEDISQVEQTKSDVSEKTTDNDKVFDVLNEETKWDKKERKKEEKAKAKFAKKRAKYADVDDDTYYAMKATGFHKAFGIFSLLLMIAGLAVAGLSVYKLVLAPSYDKVVDSVEDLEVITMATPGDSTLSQQRIQLNGLASDTDALVDTWVEEPFDESDTEDKYDNMDDEEETVSDETVEE